MDWQVSKSGIHKIRVVADSPHLIELSQEDNAFEIEADISLVYQI